MAMRHALSKYPDAKWMWYLDQNAYIVDFSRSLESHILEQKTLEGLMIRDKPIVPPDSIIKTFTHLSGQDVGLVISQDNDGLVSDSLMLRNGDWAKFVTETWLDPLYRSYNFQKAERHALVSSAYTQLVVSGFESNIRNRSTSCNGIRQSFLRSR